MGIRFKAVNFRSYCVKSLANILNISYGICLVSTKIYSLKTLSAYSRCFAQVFVSFALPLGYSVILTGSCSGLLRNYLYFARLVHAAKFSHLQIIILELFICNSEHPINSCESARLRRAFVCLGKAGKTRKKASLYRLAFWRRHPDLNWGMKLLQSFALPLGYSAIIIILERVLAVVCSENFLHLARLVHTAKISHPQNCHFGAGDEIRTRDICLGKATLYH